MSEYGRDAMHRVSTSETRNHASEIEKYWGGMWRNNFAQLLWIKAAKKITQDTNILISNNLGHFLGGA